MGILLEKKNDCRCPSKKKRNIPHDQLTKVSTTPGGRENPGKELDMDLYGSEYSS